MNVFLLTWNPDHSDEDNLAWIDETVRTTALGSPVVGRWSTGRRKGDIAIGDALFMVRQHRDRGVVARGQATTAVYRDKDWRDRRRKANYVGVRWETWLPHEDRLPMSSLLTSVPMVSWDRLQGSGVRVPLSDGAILLDLWASHTQQVVAATTQSPEELVGPYKEGLGRKTVVNRYERDPRARAACIAHWGTNCAACGFDFESRYGPLGRGYIHVHHLRDLSLLGSGYEVDPVKDLRPVCPNCHAMLHRTRPAMSVSALRRKLTS